MKNFLTQDVIWAIGYGIYLVIWPLAFLYRDHLESVKEQKDFQEHLEQLRLQGERHRASLKDKFIRDWS